MTDGLQICQLQYSTKYLEDTKNVFVWSNYSATVENTSNFEKWGLNLVASKKIPNTFMSGIPLCKNTCHMETIWQLKSSDWFLYDTSFY